MHTSKLLPTSTPAPNANLEAVKVGDAESDGEEFEVDLPEERDEVEIKFLWFVGALRRVWDMVTRAPVDPT